LEMNHWKSGVNKKTNRKSQIHNGNEKKKKRNPPMGAKAVFQKEKNQDQNPQNQEKHHNKGEKIVLKETTEEACLKSGLENSNMAVRGIVFNRKGGLLLGVASRDKVVPGNVFSSNGYTFNG